MECDAPATTVCFRLRTRQRRRAVGQTPIDLYHIAVVVLRIIALLKICYAPHSAEKFSQQIYDNLRTRSGDSGVGAAPFSAFADTN